MAWISMRARRLGIGVILVAALWAPGAYAQGFSGHVRYIGSLGPVNGQRPLCLCIYRDPQLVVSLGCMIFHTNPASFQLTRTIAQDYYLVAFLDLDINEELDPDEPYQIYQNRPDRPADPVSGTSGRTDIDFLFGDENLPGAPSATPTSTPTAIGPTATPTLVAGDCDRDGSVSIAELVRAVAIALGQSPTSACVAADLNGDGLVHIDELIAVLNAALAAGSTAAR